MQRRQSSVSAHVKGERALYGGKRVEIVEVELHHVAVDALIFPTDASFGIDGPCGKALLPVLGTELKNQASSALCHHGSLRPCDTYLLRTKGLSASHFIFCNVPKYTGESLRRRLAESVQNCLEAASKVGLKSVAIPTVGFDYPATAESVTVLRGVVDFQFKSPKSSVDRIVIVPLTEDSMYNYLLQLTKME